MNHYSDPLLQKEHKLVSYSPEVRRYHFILHGECAGAYLPAHYCPWCGKKLPKNLGKEWCKIIKEKFGLDNVFAEEWEILPEEFKTDKWWKKRRL